MAVAIPELEQLDLNPVIVDTAGCVVVDARLAVSTTSHPSCPCAGCVGTSADRSGNDRQRASSGE